MILDPMYKLIFVKYDYVKLLPTDYVQEVENVKNIVVELIKRYQNSSSTYNVDVNSHGSVYMIWPGPGPGSVSHKLCDKRNDDQISTSRDAAFRVLFYIRFFLIVFAVCRLQQNRPLNVQNVADALQKFNLKKGPVQKALDSLEKSSKILFKEYGKQKIYMARQDQFDIPNSEELSKMKEANDKLQEQFGEVKRQISAVEGEIKALQSNLTMEEIRVKEAKLKKEVNEMEERLIKLRKGVTLVRPEDRKAVENMFSEKLNQWRKRKRMFKDVWDTITENSPKDLKEFKEELGIEYDEDVGESLQSLTELLPRGNKRSREIPIRKDIFSCWVPLIEFVKPLNKTTNRLLKEDRYLKMRPGSNKMQSQMFSLNQPLNNLLPNQPLNNLLPNYDQEIDMNKLDPCITLSNTITMIRCRIKLVISITTKTKTGHDYTKKVNPNHASQEAPRNVRSSKNVDDRSHENI
ncbi:hypothetical protein ACFE04_016296 [Oxalis oulophora]